MVLMEPVLVLVEVDTLTLVDRADLVSSYFVTQKLQVSTACMYLQTQVN